MIRPTIAAFVLIDVPVWLAISVLGFVYGFRDVATAYLDWRAAHPWTWLISLGAVSLLLVYRRRRARRARSR